MFRGVAAPHVGFASPMFRPAFFVHDCTVTWPFAWNVSHQTSTAALSSTMPPAPPAPRMSTSDARKLLKLIGDLMIVRIVVESYFCAPLIIVVAPVMLPSA